jgi:hypothetical protein
MKKQRWRKIADNKVLLVWRHEDCGNTVKLPPTFFENNGTPICDNEGCCGDDMQYIRTEILK